MKRSILTLHFLLFLIIGNSQVPFPENRRIFDDEQLSRVDIYIHPDSLDLIYQNVESDHEFPATFRYTFIGGYDELDNIGFRLRGNTSRYSQKKSFKVAVNSFESGRNYLGLEKLNLNGEHNDPSIIRSKLCWDIFRKFKVIGSRANHIKMYINDNYYGLYINVEHVDEEFVGLRYGSKVGNLYKCTWPSDLNYISDNPDDYKPENGPAYELKTNLSENNYSDLAHFISILNNTTDDDLPSALEEVFNVNNYLKYQAVEIFTGHWDGYAFNKNNFYLYNNPLTGKFELIPYDVDNTFGIDWFGIDWSTRNIYSWMHPDEYRPLISRLLNNQTYRDRFSYYMKQLLDSIVDPAVIFPKIDEKKARIEQAAYDDIYRTLDYGWSTTDFDDSYTQGLVTSHVPIGLKEYITARYNSARSQLMLNDIAPIIGQVKNNFPMVNQEVIISCTVEDETPTPEVLLFYKLNGGAEQQVQMGVSGSGAANYIGGIEYKATMSGFSESGKLEYYLVASDQTGKSTRDPISGFYEMTIADDARPELYINEFMASNSTFSDDVGNTSDWIEIYNAGEESIYLGDKFLSDNYSERQKWQMPDINIDAGEFLVFWASGNAANGTMHTNFKLNADAEQIAIFNSINTGYAFIDSISYTSQITNVSTGRYPDATGDFVILGQPSPGAPNINTSISGNAFEKIKLSYYPNPFKSSLNIQLPSRQDGELEIKVYNILGALVHSEIQNGSFRNKLSLNLTDLQKGNYLLRIINVNTNLVVGDGICIKQ